MCESGAKPFNAIQKPGIKLFIVNGYEATTLDAIAQAADIS